MRRLVRFIMRLVATLTSQVPLGVFKDADRFTVETAYPVPYADLFTHAVISFRKAAVSVLLRPHGLVSRLSLGTYRPHIAPGLTAFRSKNLVTLIWRLVGRVFDAPTPTGLPIY